MIRTNRIPLLFTENPMRKNQIRIMALAFVVPIFSSWSACAQAQVEKAPYPVMAPLDQYLISDENAEIALARSAPQHRFPMQPK